MPRVILATGFNLRADKTTGFIEVLIESSVQKGELVYFDPVLLRGNIDSFTRYGTSLSVEPDDAAVKDNIKAGDIGTFSNIVHFSQMGGRAETIFGNFCLSDWVDATKRAQTSSPEVVSRDLVSIMSTLALQKKMLLDLILLIKEDGGSK